MRERYCPLIICFICEFIGTSTLMFIGCMGCIDPFAFGPTIPAFSFGCAVLGAILMFGHFTPVHLNPAITIAMLILGRIGWRKVLVYIPTQYIGAMVGYSLLKVSVMDHPSLCLLSLKDGTSPTQGYFLEMFVTMALLLVVAGSTDDANQHLQDSISIRLALVITGMLLALIPYTGAGLNPARSLPPCIMYNIWQDHWLYHIAPYKGAALGAILYRMLFDSSSWFSLYSIIKTRSWLFWTE